MTSIQKLSAEMLLLVFSFLKFREVLFAVPAVCRLWRSVFELGYPKANNLLAGETASAAMKLYCKMTDFPNTATWFISYAAENKRGPSWTMLGCCMARKFELMKTAAGEDAVVHISDAICCCQIALQEKRVEYCEWIVGRPMYTDENAPMDAIPFCSICMTCCDEGYLEGVMWAAEHIDSDIAPYVLLTRAAEKKQARILEYLLGRYGTEPRPNTRRPRWRFFLYMRIEELDIFSTELVLRYYMMTTLPWSSGVIDGLQKSILKKKEWWHAINMLLWLHANVRMSVKTADDYALAHLENACRENTHFAVLAWCAIRKLIGDTELDHLFMLVCAHADLDSVVMLHCLHTEKPTIWNECFEMACRRGNTRIASFMHNEWPIPRTFVRERRLLREANERGFVCMGTWLRGTFLLRERDA